MSDNLTFLDFYENNREYSNVGYHYTLIQTQNHQVMIVLMTVNFRFVFLGLIAKYAVKIH